MSVPPLSSLGSSFPSPQAFSPGLITKASTDGDIYLIDPEGYRRLVPLAAVKTLFLTTLKVAVNDQLPLVKSGPPISADAFLGKGPSGGVFFGDKPYPGSITFGYRWIINTDVAAKYQFNLDGGKTISADTLKDGLDPRFWA